MTEGKEVGTVYEREQFNKPNKSDDGSYFLLDGCRAREQQHTYADTAINER